MNRRTKSAICIIIYCAVIGICLASALYVCANKSGFHEDEFYTYYSTNRTAGFWIEDGELMDRSTILDEYRVVPGEGFNFRLVKEVQSWDVHPPVYYFLVHLVCSLTPGVFNMWQGLVLNLIFYGISIILVMWLSHMLSPQKKYVPAIIALIYGVSAATLTAVVFIRMYMILTVWILAVTILHVYYLGREKKPKYGFYITLGILTFLGFMTHYYFFIWLFFLAVLVNLYELITTHKWMGIIKYGITMVVTFTLCYLFYPAWPAQMFRGQRGAQATGNFFDLSNTWERICFFAGKVNNIGFGKLLWVIIPLMITLGVICLARRTFSFDVNTVTCVILIAASILYFLVVSKTGLMLGDSSIRYQMPVLGVIVVAMGALFITLLGQIGLSGAKLYMAAGAVASVMIIGNIMSDCSGSISFLYPEEAKHQTLIDGALDPGAIYIYNEDPTQTWCVWASTDELVRFDEVLFLAAESEDDLAEPAREYIESKDTLFVYVDSTVDIDKVINRTNGIIAEISTKDADYSHKFCDIYIINK